AAMDHPRREKKTNAPATAREKDAVGWSSPLQDAMAAPRGPARSAPENEPDAGVHQATPPTARLFWRGVMTAPAVYVLCTGGRRARAGVWRFRSRGNPGRHAG